MDVKEFLNMDFNNNDNINLYFCRPNKGYYPEFYDSLINDLITSKTIWIAMAWFTDRELVNASFAHKKDIDLRIILNHADLSRKSSGGNIIEHIRDNEYRKGGIDVNVGVKKIGEGVWKEGLIMMHHKFIVCDTSVWTGSYNASFQARYNYEMMIRFSIPSVIFAFRKEFIHLWNIAESINVDEYLSDSDLSLRYQPCPMCGQKMDIESYGFFCTHCQWSWDAGSHGFEGNNMERDFDGDDTISDIQF